MAGTQLFIVRIARDREVFEATARRVDEEAVGRFDQPQALLDFLIGKAPEPVTATDRTTRGETDDHA